MEYFNFINMSSMLVSIILNTYNEKKEYLVEAIESYLHQTIKTEIIVSTIDDDRNLELIKSFPVKVVTMKKEEHPGKSPLGSFMQINNALSSITGEWFSFASSNDIALPFKNEMEVNCCMNNGKDVCYSAFDIIDESGMKINERKFHEHNNIRFIGDYWI